MSQLIEVKVPDIGDFSDVPIIELYVKVGDTLAVDDAIATLESDKATMDVPSTAAGVVKEVLVKLGDSVSEGSVLIKVEAAGDGLLYGQDLFLLGIGFLQSLFGSTALGDVDAGADDIFQLAVIIEQSCVRPGDESFLAVAS